MDKTAIKNFSIWARNKLIADITYKAGLLGVTEEGIKDALPQSTQDAEFYDIGTKEPYAIHGEEIKQRKELVAAIKRKATQLDYKDAYRNVVEEVAYTWFNRLIAIRFMEVNDYMPAHIRVLSSDSKNKLEPDLVTTPFDAEIEFTQAETEKIIQMKNDNQVDALFRFLFIKQCNALNAYLPKLFEKTSDYTELLLNVSVTDQDGIVYHLTHDIKEADFNISDLGEDGKPTGQVEIIGWMYQYYNTEPKDEIFALLKSNVKITKERIPAATQLFTPDWIVRYMVENSVGRLWLEGHEDNNLKNEWKYYLDEAEQEADVAEQLRTIREEYKNIKPEEIKVIDPCMGSGHILVYAFDVLMQIYESYGYSRRDAAVSIVQNNIYGLDIDDRAFQLAYFAIMMKARSYNRRFLTLEIEPNLSAIQESNGLQYDKDMGDFLLSEEHRDTLKYLLNTFVDAKEYGSILNVEKRDYDGFLEAWNLTAEATLGNVVMMLWYNECNQIVPILAKQAKILSQKFECVITNPPYMGASNGSLKLNEYLKVNYPNTKSDLFAAFIEKGSSLAKDTGLISLITQHSWMFLASYERLRETILRKTTVNMAHLGARAFEEIAGEVVQTTSFVLCNRYVNNYAGTFLRLVDYGGQQLKENAFLDKQQVYISTVNRFDGIPGKPFAYWVSDEFVNIFNNPLFYEYSISDGQNKTGNNARFVRDFWEVAKDDIGINKKWLFYAKGGGYRKWYGNLQDVVDWSEPTRQFYREDRICRIIPEYLWYKKGITWGLITTTIPSFRILPEAATFDVGGSSIFLKDEKYFNYYLGLFNSKVYLAVAKVLNPTINVQVKDIRNMPIIYKDVEKVNALVENIVELTKADWDMSETSWGFKKHPFIAISQEKGLFEVSKCFDEFSKECEDRFVRVRELEEEINRIFISNYGLEKEIVPDVDDKEISVRLADKKLDVSLFISYVIGCLFGRYSIDKEGIVYAGGQWKPEEYKEIIPDEDNIMIITDEEYIEDDVTSRFVEFIAKVFGHENLESNLDFIAEALETKGNSNREKIRNYFLTRFVVEHNSNYSVTSGKRPIYWLFDSGKQNGFKALVYLHRYNADTIGNLRVDYLHRMERIYESEINRMQDTIDNSSNAREVTAATKRKEKLQRQLKECQEYDEKIGHLALSRIEIDLDDGVKINYEKVQTASDGKKYQVLAKI